MRLATMTAAGIEPGLMVEVGATNDVMMMALSTILMASNTSFFELRATFRLGEWAMAPR